MFSPTPTTPLRRARTFGPIDHSIQSFSNSIGETPVRRPNFGVATPRRSAPGTPKTPFNNKSILKDRELGASFRPNASQADYNRKSLRHALEESVYQQTQGGSFEIGEDCARFAEILAHGGAGDVFEENGLVDGYWTYCQEKIEKLRQAEDEDPTFNNSPEATELAWWKLEASTWRLIKSLLGIRFQATEGMATDPPSDAYASDEAIASMIHGKDFEEMQTVLAWLEETAPGEFDAPETRREYLEHTVKHIQALKRLGPKNFAADIVTDADPDAATRQHKQIKPFDSEYEASLHRTAYEYIRRGLRGDALSLYSHSGQPWHAASLSGGDLWNAPDNDGVNEVKHGNQNRDLWKAVCYQIASNPSYDAYERACYAVSSGDVNNATQVCKFWEDYLWAYYSALIESKTDQRLRAVPLPMEPDEAVDVEFPSAPLEAKEIFDALEKGDNEHLRTSSQEPFHIVQKAIILNDINALMSQFTSNLQGQTSQFGTLTPHFLRFMAHFALLMQDISLSIPTDDVTAIVEQYVQALTQGKQNELVAQYASFLPSSIQVERYAMFMQNVLDDPDMKRYLHLAKQHGMDATAIAQEAALIAFREGVLSDRFSAPAPKDLFIAQLNDNTTAEEERQVLALGWLLYDTDLSATALFCSNILIRKYLACGRVNAAAMVPEFLRRSLGKQNYIEVLAQPEWLYGALAGGSVDGTTEIQDATLEHMHYGWFFDGMRHYQQWLSILYSRPPPAAPGLEDHESVEHRRWLHEFRAVTRAAQQSFEMLLDMDWLVPTATSRLETVRAELESLQDIYIPQLVEEYYQVLYETRQILPGNLEKSEELIARVEDEQSDEHRHFVRVDKLHTFLHRIRQSAK
ncbi:nuclear pore protein 84/107 [Phlyctochytrium arcticum]|nr:nuclear pore protein 84/107 [Phlyctochytrium arcticum]